MAEPPDGVPVAAGRGDLRAAHADREQVIGMLKAAFVQGMLTKDEFDGRMGQVFESQTCAQLDALSADLPAGLATTASRPAQAQGEPRIPRPGRVLAVATVLYAAVWPVGLLLPWNSEGEPQAALLLITSATLIYTLLLLTAGTPVLADWLNKHW
jgi:hypothetical protein